MADTIRITLDDRAVQVPAGSTILEAARAHGVHIPTLCHDDRLEPTGSCRVCLVAVEGARCLMPSCTTKAADGMKIDTQSPEVLEARHQSLALLVSDHYGDCVSPCSLECPANIDIQGYIALIAAGKYREAVELIKEKNPMPVTIGRVCPHPCESVCRRTRVEQPIAINNLKRFAADLDLFSGTPWLPGKQPATGKKVAVIGSGPAGLSAAWYLALNGHQVTIFEKMEKPGGMLRYGIPEYRLPKEVLDREIELILSVGIELRCGVEFGSELNTGLLKEQGYDAVFLGIGAGKSMPMRIQGEDSPGVIGGIDFLTAQTRALEDGEHGYDLRGKTVLVVGGGNTAMDAARTALRMGGSPVRILYRRTRNEMPAHDLEIEEAEEEGVELHYLTAPVRAGYADGGLNVECVEMELGQPDSSGRRRPVPVENSEHVLRADYLITAIGQRPDIQCVRELDLATARDLVKADAVSGITKIKSVYSAGDCVTGAATVIEALAGGRRAADSIHAFLSGRPRAAPAPFTITKGELTQVPEEVFSLYPKADRARMPVVQPGERRAGFVEIAQGIDEAQARAEARRCLECGCVAGFDCRLRDHSTEYQVAPDEYTGDRNRYHEHNNILAGHPAIARDQNKCVKCGICVRICDEVWGLHVYGFTDRGFETGVEPSFDRELSRTACDFCGQCADACPTGALSLNPPLPKPGPFKIEKREGTCVNCPLGCELVWNVYDGVLVSTSGVPLRGENEGNLCVRGRFGYRHLTGSSDTAQVYENGQARAVTVDHAVSEARELLRRGRTAILTSTSLTDEEYGGVHSLARELGAAEVFHIPHDPGEGTLQCSDGVYPTMDRGAALQPLTRGLARARISELGSGPIVLFNIRPGRSFPILEMKIRHAAQNGTPLYIIGEHPVRLDQYATRVFRVKPKHYAGLLGLLGRIRSDIASQGGSAGAEARPGTETRPAANTGTHASEPHLFPDIDPAATRKMEQKLEKVIELARATLDTTCTFITDADVTPAGDLQLFLMNARVQPENARIMLMQRGMNPLGALPYCTGVASSGLSPDMLGEFDTLLYYKLPILWNPEGKPVVHAGCGEPVGLAAAGRSSASTEPSGAGARHAPGLIRYGVHLPADSVLHTGGTRRTYAGDEVLIEPVLHSARGSAARGHRILDLLRGNPEHVQ